jgi:hypothetical protein
MLLIEPQKRPKKRKEEKRKIYDSRQKMELQNHNENVAKTIKVKSDRQGP